MKRLAALFGVLLLTAPVANAAVSDAEFEALRAQLLNALDRLEELERANAETTATVADVQQEVEQVQTASNEMSWADRISWSGDFRYRYQADEAKDLLLPNGAVNGEQTRNRQRIRARPALKAKLPGNVEVGFGLATGGDDPVSSNQTLGGAGSSKDVKLDLAYFDWMFAENAYLEAGKFKNPFYRVGKSGLLWDSDWRPEGADVRYEGRSFYVTGLGTWLESDSRDSSSRSASAFNYGGQAGWTPEFGSAKANIGVGYYKIKSEGIECYNAPSDSPGETCFSNTAFNPITGNVSLGNVDVSALNAQYIMDYAPLELYADVTFGTRLPLRLFVDYAKNLDAKAVPANLNLAGPVQPDSPSTGEKLDTGYALGVQVGDAKQARQWHLKLIYQDLDADAVLGLLTDSDFSLGGTDSRGWVLRGKYALTERTSLDFAYFDTERKDSNGLENGMDGVKNPFDINSLFLDVNFKYK